MNSSVKQKTIKVATVRWVSVLLLAAGCSSSCAEKPGFSPSPVSSSSHFPPAPGLTGPSGKFNQIIDEWLERGILSVKRDMDQLARARPDLTVADIEAFERRVQADAAITAPIDQAIAKTKENIEKSKAFIRDGSMGNEIIEEAEDGRKQLENCLAQLIRKKEVVSVTKDRLAQLENKAKGWVKYYLMTEASLGYNEAQEKTKSMISKDANGLLRWSESLLRRDPDSKDASSNPTDGGRETGAGSGHQW